MTEFDLTTLPNIGKTLSEKLSNIGVTTYDDLVALGSVEAVLRINEQNLTACYNMLYAIEGAIQGIRWFGIPKPERDLLKQEYDNSNGQINRANHPTIATILVN